MARPSAATRAFSPRRLLASLLSRGHVRELERRRWLRDRGRGWRRDLWLDPAHQLVSHARWTAMCEANRPPPAFGKPAGTGRPPPSRDNWCEGIAHPRSSGTSPIPTTRPPPLSRASAHWRLVSIRDHSYA